MNTLKKVAVKILNVCLPSRFKPSTRGRISAHPVVEKSYRDCLEKFGQLTNEQIGAAEFQVFFNQQLASISAYESYANHSTLGVKALRFFFQRGEKEHYFNFEKILDDFGISNEANINQCLHFAMMSVDQNVDYIHSLLLRLTKDTERKSEKIERFIYVVVSRLVNAGKHEDFFKVERILNDNNLSGVAFFKLGVTSSLATENWPLLGEYLLRIKQRLEDEATQRNIVDYLNSHSAVLANSMQHDDGHFVAVDNVLLSPNVESVPLVDGKAEYAFKQNDIEDFSIQLDGMRKQAEHCKLAKICYALTRYHMAALLDKDDYSMYQKIDQILLNNDIDIIRYAIGQLYISFDKDLDVAALQVDRIATLCEASEFSDHVYSAVKYHMRELYLTRDYKQHAANYRWLSNKGCQNDVLTSQKIIFELEHGGDISGAKSSITKLALSSKKAFLKTFSQYISASIDGDMSDVTRQNIEFLIQTLPESEPLSAYRYCATVGKFLFNSHTKRMVFALEVAKKTEKINPLLSAFLFTLVHAFDEKVEKWDAAHFEYYMFNETEHQTGWAALMSNLQGKEGLSDRALLKLYKYCVDINDTKRAFSLFQALYHQPNFKESHGDLNALHQSVLANSVDHKVTVKNLQKVNVDNPKILILTCIWKREALTKIILEYYSELAKKMSGHIELSVLVVGSDGKPSYLDDLGLHYLNFANKPLSNKWQAGIDHAQTIEHDAVVIIGSDDLVSEQQFYEYRNALKNGVLFYGVADLVITEGEHKAYWPGYQFTVNPRRYLESIGAARMLSSALLASLEYKLWDTKKINKGLDRLVTEKLEKIGMLCCKPDFAPTIRIGENNYQWGQLLHDYNDNKLFVTDFKVGGNNVTAFQSFVKDGNCQLWVTKQHLVDQYGESVIQKISQLH